MTVEFILANALWSKITLAVIAMDRVLAESRAGGAAIENAWMAIHVSLALADGVYRELAAEPDPLRRVELLADLNSCCANCIKGLDLLWSLMDGEGPPQRAREKIE
ncbi:MAG: hypothetical protein KCHDKBKB_03104 [Elusimicrobia bacterium]|nr:hypothetical protein [Elusimicrobiota bacterium]